MANAPLLPLTIAGIGAYLAWFGVHYWASDVEWPSDPIKAVLTGKPIPSNAVNNTGLIEELEKASTTVGIPSNAAPGSTIAAGGTALGQRIANDAMQYVGTGYVYAGNASKIGDWDCSSFVSYVLGHDLGIPLPGGNWGDPGFPPHAHGPASGGYMMYGQGIELSQVNAGDLIATTDHIAIAISPTMMVSAQDERLGVGTSTFPAGFPGGPPVYRRVTG